MNSVYVRNFVNFFDENSVKISVSANTPFFTPLRPANGRLMKIRSPYTYHFAETPESDGFSSNTPTSNI